MKLQRMKRIEIVIDSLHLPRLLEALTAAGAPGHTVLSNVEGRGDRGEQRADDISGVSSNSYVLVAAPVEDAERIIDAVGPLLRRFGGICLVGECEWVEH